MPNYKQSSPYFATGYSENFLDVMTNRPIPRQADDQYVTLNQAYEYRPDLLAYDLYEDSNLWWVFAQRNPNTIKDPIWDFKTGIKIFLPKISTLKTALGI